MSPAGDPPPQKMLFLLLLVVVVSFFLQGKKSPLKDSQTFAWNSCRTIWLFWPPPPPLRSFSFWAGGGGGASPAHRVNVFPFIPPPLFFLCRSISLFTLYWGGGGERGEGEKKRALFLHPHLPFSVLPFPIFSPNISGIIGLFLFFFLLLFFPVHCVCCTHCHTKFLRTKHTYL